MNNLEASLEMTAGSLIKDSKKEKQNECPGWANDFTYTFPNINRPAKNQRSGKVRKKGTVRGKMGQQNFFESPGLKIRNGACCARTGPQS
jgi:hypothetical protein